MGLPTGTVTFLFTDIEGSTALWETYPDQMRIALAKHDAILRAAIESNNGIVFKTVGDAFCAAFATAPDGVAAAIDAQLALAAEPWEPPVVIRARMGLHTGSVEHRDNDYFGQALNRVARLMSVGHGGQVLVSAATQELVVDALPPRVTLRDMGTHRLKDLGRPEELYQVQHADLPSDFRALRSLGNPELPNNLPPQVTSFVGREKEVADLTRLLESSRLVTLTAAGGTGKTRISLQVAADMLDRFADGVWFVELAAVTEPELVAHTIAHLVNINEVPGEPILRTLTNGLKSRKLLLILDNCEHLIATCAEVVSALLRSCSGVTVLASSRQAMNIVGETVYALPALSLPDPKKPQSPLSLSQYDSVRLFVDRAVAVRADFSVSNQNAAALAQLCHRLDGIPLALELAAARVRVLSVEEINSRLDNRFRLLTGGSRNVLPRQQTLRALIDWSYDLLNEQERSLFARLSVFVGGWSLDAAEQVCAGDAIEDWEIFDLLTALADKSLVVSDTESVQVRFRLLETLREYGREKPDSGEAEDLAQKHADFYADAVTAKSNGSSGIGEAEFGWVLTEADNLRAALDWLWRVGRQETAATVSVNLREFWYRMGWLREAFTNLDGAVKFLDGLSDKELRARVLKDSGWFAFLMRDLVAAEQLTAASVEASVDAGSAEIQANALNGLALIVQKSGDLDRAETLFTQAIALFRTLGNETVLADYLMNLGFLQSTRGKHAEAQELFAEARAILEKHSSAVGMAGWLCNQSDLALRQANWKEAQALAEQSVERFRKIEHRVGIAYALVNLAEAAARQDEHELTAESVREAVSICRETNHPDLLPVVFVSYARSLLAQGRPGPAAELIAGSMRLRSILNMPLKPDEARDLGLLEESVRAAEPEDLLSAAASRMSLLGADEVIAQLSAVS